MTLRKGALDHDQVEGAEPPYVRPDDYRERDEHGQLIPRNPMGDGLALMRGMPNVASMFQRAVPDSHLDGRTVKCVCGAQTPELEVNEVVFCPGECGRAFLRFSDTEVRCANPQQDVSE